MKIQELWLSVSVVTLVGCGTAVAQVSSAPGASSSDTISEVVVTAERRHTDLQTTPISATVLSGTELANMGVTGIDQLQFATPGATIDNFGQGIDFNIRGIGKAEHNSQTTVGVVTYRDGIATFPGYFQEEPYYDVASVEILRGPQGTFGGQNATGGAVFVTTNDPNIGGGYDGYVQAQVGNYTDFAAARRGQYSDQRHVGGALRLQWRKPRQLLQRHRSQWRRLHGQSGQSCVSAAAHRAPVEARRCAHRAVEDRLQLSEFGRLSGRSLQLHRGSIQYRRQLLRNKRSTGSAARC